MRAAWIVQGIGYALIVAALVYAASRSSPTTAPQASDTTTSSTSSMPTLTITSPAFRSGETIPAKYTCDGDDILPPLVFGGAPKGTLTYALIVEDPDAPAGVWDHWVVFNIPAEHTLIGEGETPPSTQGKNTAGNTSYHGPCPPNGAHHYVFKLYALGTNLRLPQGASKAEVLETMKGHVLATAELVGTYQRLEI